MRERSKIHGKLLQNKLQREREDFNEEYIKMREKITSMNKMIKT